MKERQKRLYLTRKHENKKDEKDSTNKDVGMCQKISLLTRMALKTVELMPSATSNSPLSLGRVKLLSRPEPNILKTNGAGHQGSSALSFTFCFASKLKQHIQDAEVPEATGFNFPSNHEKLFQNDKKNLKCKTNASCFCFFFL